MKILEKANIYVGLFVVGALFGLLIFVSGVEIKDLDLWLHLGVGKYIMLSGSVPQEDLFNVVTTGHFWNNHEWLFQLLVWNVFSQWGEQGLSQMQTVVVTFTMMLLFFIGYSKERQFIMILSLIFVYFVYISRFTIRPDLFSLTFFTLYIFIMSLHIDKRWSLPALVIVQVLWTNFHGFFFFGPLFVLIGLFSEWMKRHVKLPWEWNQSGRLTDEEYGRLKIALVLVSVACLANPQGVEGALYPIKVFFSLSGGDSIFFDYIQELKPPVEWGDFFGGGNYAYYKLMIIVSALTFFLNRRRLDISALILWIIFLLFSLKAIRNISFFAFTAYLCIISNCYYLAAADVIPLRFNSKRFVYITGIFCKILLLGFIAENYNVMAERGYYDFDKYQRKSEFGGIAKRTYPSGAADFIIENGIKANIFNDFNSGAYLIGRTFPNIKVFMDGRTELYGGEFFRQYLKIWEQGNPEIFEAMVAKYNLTGAFLNSSREDIPKEILRYLDQQKEWIPVYFNSDGVFFLKDVPEHRAIIERYAVDFENWQPPYTDLLRMGIAKAEPYEHNYRAFTLESMDYDEAALREAKEALRIKPDYADPLKLIGKVFAKRKQFRSAFEAFRHACLYDPGNKKLRYNLALSYLDMSEYEGAIAAYRDIHVAWPADPKAVFFLSKAYAFNRQYDESLKMFQEAVKMAPASAGDAVNIADVIFADGKYDTAVEMYRTALEINDKLPAVHRKIGEAYRALDQPELAEKHLKRAAELKPPEDEAAEAAVGETAGSPQAAAPAAAGAAE
ncbi:MAG: tetratricopeptide repeat protein [Candidatus Omnitrophica bacterium]|nr:tetratricopeptide repeat protein [Candidatus Omnitrophota bacterium]